LKLIISIWKSSGREFDHERVYKRLIFIQIRYYYSDDDSNLDYDPTKEQAAYSCVNVNCSFAVHQEIYLGLNDTLILEATFSES